jgi:hypothetical protein
VANPMANNAHDRVRVPAYLLDFSPVIHTRTLKVLEKLRHIYSRCTYGLHDLPEMSNIPWLDISGWDHHIPQMYISLGSEYY